MCLFPYNILPPEEKIESVDKLAADLNKIFTFPEQFLDDDVFRLPMETKLSPPINKVHAYFNTMHNQLTNKRASYFTARDNNHRKDKCRVFLTVEKAPTLKELCKKFIHSNLCVTYQSGYNRLISSFEYQNDIIQLLDIPRTLQKELLQLYYECDLHFSLISYRFTYPHGKRFFFRKNSVAYNYLKSTEKFQYLDLHGIYTQGEVMNIILREFPRSIRKEIMQSREITFQNIGEVEEYIF